MLPCWYTGIDRFLVSTSCSHMAIRVFRLWAQTFWYSDNSSFSFHDKNPTLNLLKWPTVHLSLSLSSVMSDEVKPTAGTTVSCIGCCLQYTCTSVVKTIRGSGNAIFQLTYECFGERGGTVVKVLCYKSEGCLFDSGWCHWNFSLTDINLPIALWQWGRLSL